MNGLLMTAKTPQNNRELKESRRRCRGRRLVKINYTLYQRNSQLSRSAQNACGSENVLRLNICNDSVLFQMETRKISRRRLRSSDDAAFAWSFQSCIRPMHLKFELTNQDSAGGRNKPYSVCTVLPCMLWERHFKSRLPLLTGDGINIHENGFLIPKTHHIAKGEKDETFCLKTFHLAPNMGRSRRDTCLSIAVAR